MGVSLRLTRMGKRKHPFYRVVAVDSRKARDGKYIESLGYYDPFKETGKVTLYSKESIFKWFKYGAQPTAAVRRLLSSQGVLMEWEALKKENRSQSKVEERTNNSKKKTRKGRCRPMAEKIKLREEQKSRKVRQEEYLRKKQEEKKKQAAKEAAETKEASEKADGESSSQTDENPKETSNSLKKGGEESESVSPSASAESEDEKLSQESK